MVGSMIGPSVNVNLFSLEFYTRNHTTEDILNFFMQKNSQRTNIFGYLDGMNLYTYVRNNSINYLDPFGLKSASSDPRVQKYLAELAQKSAYCFRFEPNNNKCWSDVEKKARECAKTAADVTKEPEPYDPTNDNCDRSGQLDNPGAI
ncbi:MAG: hypothetical protein JNN05_04340 [Candidatus Omnitrophica bacterium]|nr:hypothetical protein [Candidatus Omnitrophota bacterium]